MTVMKQAIKRIKKQNIKGLKKYKVSLDNSGLTVLELLEHLAQEQADALQYTEALILLLKGKLGK